MRIGESGGGIDRIVAEKCSSEFGVKLKISELEHPELSFSELNYSLNSKGGKR